MNTALIVDYAGLYHTAWEAVDGSLPGSKHGETFDILRKLERYLTSHDTRVLRGAKIVTRHVFLLNRQPFREATEIAAMLGWGVTLSEWRRRTASEAVRNFSANDDTELKQFVAELLPQIDALVLVARDSDFVNTLDMVRYAGRAAILAPYETPKKRLSRFVADRADLVLPLREIAAEEDEPEPLPPAPEEVLLSDANSEFDRPGEPLIELHHRGCQIGNFPLRDAELEIGRRSKRLGHFPQVDLGPYDVTRTTSRRHLLVRRTLGEQLVLQVHSACTQGTWLNGDPVFPGEIVPLRDRDQIVLGNGTDDSFGLLLHLPEIPLPKDHDNVV
jgi:hypothetical protein